MTPTLLLIHHSHTDLGYTELQGRITRWHVDFIRQALDGMPDREPAVPEGIVTVRIDPRTGARAGPDTEGALFEVFRSENEPGVGMADGGLAVPSVTPPPTQELF
mgnify:CR=1 FL=1